MEESIKLLFNLNSLLVFQACDDNDGRHDTKDGVEASDWDEDDRDDLAIFDLICHFNVKLFNCFTVEEGWDEEG